MDEHYNEIGDSYSQEGSRFMALLLSLLLSHSNLIHTHIC